MIGLWATTQLDKLSSQCRLTCIPDSYYRWCSTVRYLKCHLGGHSLSRPKTKPERIHLIPIVLLAPLSANVHTGPNLRFEIIALRDCATLHHQKLCQQCLPTPILGISSSESESLFDWLSEVLDAVLKHGRYLRTWWNPAALPLLILMHYWLSSGRIRHN